MTKIRSLTAALALLALLAPAHADENSLLSIPESIASKPAAPPVPKFMEPAPEGPPVFEVAQPELIEPEIALPKEFTPPEQISPEEVQGEASPSDDPNLSALSRELKPVLELRVDISAPAGKLPENYAAELRRQSPTPAGEVLLRTWPMMAYHWTAPGSRHYPLYFEEINPERYGYTYSHCAQPVISAAHFFGTIPALPYLMAANCPRECVYTLGHYRPGNCNPWRDHCWPCDPKAGLLEGAAVYGLIVLIP